MNRIYFFILTGLSSLVFVLLVGNIILARSVGSAQQQVAQAQAEINQGQSFENNLKQLAIRVYQDAQKTQDPVLKEILTRQQISYNPPATTGTETNK